MSVINLLNCLLPHPLHLLPHPLPLHHHLLHHLLPHHLPLHHHLLHVIMIATKLATKLAKRFIIDASFVVSLVLVVYAGVVVSFPVVKQNVIKLLRITSQSTSTFTFDPLHHFHLNDPSISTVFVASPSVTSIFTSSSFIFSTFTSLVTCMHACFLYCGLNRSC